VVCADSCPRWCALTHVLAADAAAAAAAAAAATAAAGQEVEVVAVGPDYVTWEGYVDDATGERVERAERVIHADLAMTNNGGALMVPLEVLFDRVVAVAGAAAGYAVIG
jgi:hypothetical protein